MSDRSTWHKPTGVTINDKPVTRIGLVRSVVLSVLFLALLGGIVLYRKLNP